MRDDIITLPIPGAAKRYARRKGLKSMMRQPQDFAHVNHLLMNPTWRSNRFGIKTVGSQIGKSTGIKDSLDFARQIIGG
jgi:hypothetical protein